MKSVNETKKKKKKKKKSVIAKHCKENDHTLNFHSANIIYKQNVVSEHDFLDAFHIHRNHNNVFTCDFAIPPVKNREKSHIKSNFS